MAKRPFKFRAVHVGNRWRKATHESFENATFIGKRSAKALFEYKNDKVNYTEAGKPLYVVIWNSEEESADGVIVKHNSAIKNGLEFSAPVPRSVIDIWEKPRKNPEAQELEAYFESAPSEATGENSNALVEFETEEQLEQDLSAKVATAFKDSRETRLKRISEFSFVPKQVRVSTTAFIRNPDVIVEVLLRSNGICEECGKNAPFIRARDGSPCLEVHHINPLSKGGEDTISNAVAICPNCHRFFHHG